MILVKVYIYIYIYIYINDKYYVVINHYTLLKGYWGQSSNYANPLFFVKEYRLINSELPPSQHIFNQEQCIFTIRMS